MRPLRNVIRSLIHAAGWDLHRLSPRSNAAFQLLTALDRFEVDLVLDVGATSAAEVAEPGFQSLEDRFLVGRQAGEPVDAPGEGEQEAVDVVQPNAAKIWRPRPQQLNPCKNRALSRYGHPRALHVQWADAGRRGT